MCVFVCRSLNIFQWLGTQKNETLCHHILQINNGAAAEPAYTESADGVAAHKRCWIKSSRHSGYRAYHHLHQGSCPIEFYIVSLRSFADVTSEQSTIWAASATADAYQTGMSASAATAAAAATATTTAGATAGAIAGATAGAATGTLVQWHQWQWGRAVTVNNVDDNLVVVISDDDDHCC